MIWRGQFSVYMRSRLYDDFERSRAGAELIIQSIRKSLISTAPLPRQKQKPARIYDQDEFGQLKLS